MHKNRSLLAFTSQFDMTATAASAAAAAADDDEDGSGRGDDDDRLSSVRVLLSSICFMVTSFSHSMHEHQLRREDLIVRHLQCSVLSHNDLRLSKSRHPHFSHLIKTHSISLTYILLWKISLDVSHISLQCLAVYGYTATVRQLHKH